VVLPATFEVGGACAHAGDGCGREGKGRWLKVQHSTKRSRVLSEFELTCCKFTTVI
jgi:hypothetical protein